MQHVLDCIDFILIIMVIDGNDDFDEDDNIHDAKGNKIMLYVT